MEQNNRPLEKELLDIIFGEKTNVKLWNKEIDCQSTIRTALQDAQFNSRFAKKFVSLILHLIALEQIGDLFCPEEKGGYNYGIAKALKTFMPKLNPRERQGSTNLRHALAHNFGLSFINNDQIEYYNTQNNKKIKAGEQPEYDLNETNYKYILHFAKEYKKDDKTETYPLIKQPDIEWNGEFRHTELRQVADSKLNSTDSFEICVPLLIEKIKEVYEILKQKHQKGELHFASKSGNNIITDNELCEIAFKYFVYNE